MFAPKNLEAKVTDDHKLIIQFPDDVPAGTTVKVHLEVIEPDGVAASPRPELARQVIITPAEEGGYLVEVPSLPGCFSEGDTLEEALANIREAIALYLDVQQEDGEEIPSEAVKPIHDERDRLREELIAKGILTRIELPPDFRAPSDEEVEAAQERTARLTALYGGPSMSEIIKEERSER